MTTIVDAHWYHADGRAQHTVPNAKGFPRPTTLADARKWHLLPSVTTILGVVDKYTLTQWRLRQAALVAYGERPAVTVDATGAPVRESSEEYAARILSMAHAPVDAAADEGSRIHAAVEASFQSGAIVPPAYAPHVEAVRAALTTACGSLASWRAEQRVVHHARGYAGTCDLHDPAGLVVADIKTKDMLSSERPKRMAYDQDRQLAAYAAALFGEARLADVRLISLFVSRMEPGFVVLHEWGAVPQWHIAQPWGVFCAAADLWRQVHRYDPRVTEGAS